MTARRNPGVTVIGVDGSAARPAADAGAAPASTPRTVPALPHVPALDGLRGIAVAGVLLFHTGYLDGGFLGVDLFFVLSGFLITGLLLKEADADGRVSLLSFWGRRLRRLFPALAAMLVVVTLAVWTLQRISSPVTDPNTVATTLSDGLWVQLNLINWHLLAQDASYWDTFGQSRVFEHLWSIAVEEQFYLMWPLVIGTVAWTASRIRGSRRNVHIAVLGAATALSVLSVLLMITIVDQTDPTRVYTGTDTRAFSLLIGAAAATAPARRLFRRVVIMSRSAAGWSIGILTATLLLSWVIVDGTRTPGLYAGGLLGHAIACAVLISLSVAVTTVDDDGESSARMPLPVRVLQARPLNRLGGVSYATYLWHWPVIVLFPDLQPLGASHWLHSALVIGTSIAIAAASKLLIEDPIRFRAGWARGRTGLIVFLTVSSVLLAMWFALPLPAPPPIDIGEL